MRAPGRGAFIAGANVRLRPLRDEAREVPDGGADDACDNCCVLETSLHQDEAPLDVASPAPARPGGRHPRERRLLAAIEVLRAMNDDERSAPGLRRAVGDLERRLRALRSTE